MAEGLLIAVRWSLYADLGMLFGLPLFALFALRREEREPLLPLRRPLAMLGALGLALSGLGFLLITASMMGVEPRDVDSATLIMLLSESALGWAIVTRAIGLTIILALTCMPPSLFRSLLPLTVLLAAVAAASQAWFGHGASADGLTGTAQLAADIVHILAASAWIGAIAGLILLLSSSHRANARGLVPAHRALAGFATIGTMMVTAVTATGLVNGFFLVGVANIATLPQSRYGQLLILKLVLFAGMLLLAANNRFRLTPALEVGIGRGATDGAMARLRRSLWLEIGAAVTILAIIAWIGILAPPSSLN